MKIYYFNIALSIFMLSNCVSVKKYQELETKNQQLSIEEKARNTELEREKKIREMRDKELEVARKETENAKQNLLKWATSGSQDIQKLKTEYIKIETQLQETKETLKSTQKYWVSDKQKLSSIIDSLQKQNDLNNKELAELKEKIKNTKDDNKIVMRGENEENSTKSENKQENNNNQSSLGKDLAYLIMKSSSEENQSFLTENSQGYLLEINEKFLFNDKGEVSQKANDFLQKIIEILKIYKEKSITIETTGNNDEDRPQKAEKVRQILAQSNLPTMSSDKNFSPTAFQTQNETNKKTKIFIK
jgi:outer membrane murein-binding lipoprotein Lpp